VWPEGLGKLEKIDYLMYIPGIYREEVHKYYITKLG
jgi:hypothetical protein